MSILAPLFFGVVAARWGIAAAFRLGALAWIFFAPLEPGAAASRSVGFADRRHAHDNSGAPSTTRARSSTCSFSVGEIPRRPSD